jgi:hypothetical protein
MLNHLFMREGGGGRVSRRISSCVLKGLGGRGVGGMREMVV